MSNQVAGELGDVRLYFMQSNGGLADAHRFQGKDSILSGPAGGVVGAVETARSAGFERIIGFDMGGTSTDVSHFNGAFERAFETLVAGVRMRAPMMQIHTVAAGGGSILFFDGTKYRVGPESAGANPGPACYRRGGPLTVTDCNVMLGKLVPEFFPAVFGPNADQKIDAEIVRKQIRRAGGAHREGDRRQRTPEQVAAGFLKIAVENMANAIKEISIQRGYDVTEYVLELLRRRRRPARLPGRRCAGHDTRCSCIRSPACCRPMAWAWPICARSASAPSRRSSTPRSCPRSKSCADAWARKAAPRCWRKASRRAPSRYLHRRMCATTAPTRPWWWSSAITTTIQRNFETAHRQRYGFIVAGKALIVEAASVEIVGKTEQVRDPMLASRDGGTAKLQRHGKVYSDAAWHDAPIYKREDLLAGDTVDGPAVIIESIATVMIEPGWRAQMTDRAHLVLTRVVPLVRQHAVGTEADPVMLEIFNNRFMSIAEQMGSVLENTSYSVNIKERLDFSCAIFTIQGELIANAPHMPVHLGSMGESVETVIRERGNEMKPGDVFVLNAPYNGGTHLPDVTVITPVFDEPGTELLFFVCSRGHHADIGGMTPGSMPADSKTVEDEGVLIDNFVIVDGGKFREAETRALLASGKYPARNPDQNMADLRAQIAANEKGLSELRVMVSEFGLDVVRAYMKHVQDNAEEQVRRVIGRLKDGRYTLEMDNGAKIQVAVTIDRATRIGQGRFHRHQRATARQFQRAVGGVPRRHALRFPYAGARGDPDERRLPEAASS